MVAEIQSRKNMITMHIMPVIQDIVRDVYELMAVRQLVRWILHCKSHESINCSDAHYASNSSYRT